MKSAKVATEWRGPWVVFFAMTLATGCWTDYSVDPKQRPREIHRSFMRNDLGAFKDLLDANGSDWQKGSTRIPPEMSALLPVFADAGQSRARFVAELLDRGVPVDTATADGVGEGFTALIHAAGQGTTDVVALLLSRGADPNYAAPSNGHTALMSAAGYPDVVDLLLAKGARLDTVDRFGRNAVAFAAMSGCLPAYEHLVKLGGDVQRKDMHQESAAEHLARFQRSGTAVPQGLCARR